MEPSQITTDRTAGNLIGAVVAIIAIGLFIVYDGVHYVVSTFVAAGIWVVTLLPSDQHVIINGLSNQLALAAFVIYMVFAALAVPLWAWQHKVNGPV